MKKQAKQFKENTKNLTKKVGFKFYETMNTIVLRTPAISKMFLDVWLKHEKPVLNQLDYALVSNGAYCSKQVGCCYNHLPKKKKG